MSRWNLQTVDKYRALASKLVRNPDDAQALVSQFSTLSEARENGKHYLQLARRAYLIEPENINAAFNYGSGLHRTGEFKEALSVFQKCLKMADAHWRPICLHHIGIAYRALNENRKAIEAYDQAIALTGRMDIQKDRALALMADRRLKDGLEAFEIRKPMAEERLKLNGGMLVAQQKLPAGVVHWEGQDLTGKTITVFHEEGTGDFFQFSRFISQLATRNPSRVLLTGPIPNVVEFVADNVSVDGIVPLDDFKSDYVIGSMSLPWRLGLDYKDVSGKPYFKSPAATFPLRGNLNVGLVWRGNPQYGMDVHRSMAFSEFTPLFDMPGVAFYSLQAGGPGLEVTDLGFDGFIANLEPMAKNWRETAKLIQRLDCVVTVDTAVAHLAGALGKPVYILITAASDWRWDRFSHKTVWYDSAYVIRQQKQDDWKPVIAKVREQLKGRLLARRQAA